MRDERTDVGVSVGKPPTPTASALSGQALQNPVFDRALDAWQLPELPGFCGRLERLQCRDAERVVDLLRALRTHARNREHLHEALRHVCRQLPQERQRARLENRANL